MARLRVLAWLVLGVFALNTVMGFACYRSSHVYFRRGVAPQENHLGAAAAAKGWPASPPRAWPPPTQWTRFTKPGSAHYSVYSTIQNQPAFQMSVGRYGWPAPVFEQAQFWWPWNDPQWKTTVPDESGLRIYWPGFLLVPPAIVLPIWLLLPIPAMIRAHYRSRGNRCPQCGYPVGPFAACPECGRRAKPPLAAT